MITNASNRCSCARSLQRLALLCEALALAASLEIRADVVDNFNSGNDNGFLHFDTDIILHGAAGTPIGTFASYTFPSDGHGGFAYRLQTTALPPSVGTSAGPPRSFSFETNIYSRCITAVDILAWPTTWDEAFGLLYRANNVGPGTTDGYVMNYNATDRNLQINTIASEAPTTIAETHVVLDPSSNRYHWVLYTSGANFVGLVYQLPRHRPGACWMAYLRWTFSTTLLSRWFDHRRLHTRATPPRCTRPNKN